jgi:hypothetical protein
MQETTKPTVFIGSSKEGIEVARAVEVHLEEVAEATLWNEGVFGLSYGSLESLVKSLDGFDFAVLVLTPDDLVTSRDVTYQSARDNVLLEVGLFLGCLGRERTFLIFDREAPVKVPSDLAGISLATFSSKRKDDNLVAAVGPACTTIRKAIRVLGERTRQTLAGGEFLLNIKLLKGPHDILAELVGALRSMDLGKIVIYRVLPMEFSYEVIGVEQELAEEYEKLMKHIIESGTSDIGFWDKTIYGQALNKAARHKTIEFINQCFMSCPDTTYLGVDPTYNHIGFVMLGESVTGFPSDFLWEYGIVFFGDPESSRPTPIYGFMTRSHEFIEGVLHRWWDVLATTCERRGHYWDARNFRDDPEQWHKILQKIARPNGLFIASLLRVCFLVLGIHPLPRSVVYQAYATLRVYRHTNK